MLKKVLTVLMVFIMVFALAGCAGNVDQSAPAPEGTTQQDPNAPAPEQNTGAITMEQAKEIAFNHAGVTEDVIYDYSYEQDIDNGREIFEIDFKADGYEYNYDINAADGNIIKSDKEKDID